MRMYLSSWGLGDEPEQLLSLTGGAGRAAVVANAMDAAPDPVRADAVAFELAALRGLGYSATEIDLRTADVRALADVDVVWVRGGNVFVLRAALAASGADTVLVELVRADAVAYAGYSAGCCVLAPSLRGLELVDDPGAVAEPLWDGLGLRDHAIVPHYRSDHPESAAIDGVAEHYRTLAVPHVLLRDGEALVVRGGPHSTALVSARHSWRSSGFGPAST